MPDKQLESEKDALIQSITDGFSRGAIEMGAFERAVTRISACSDSKALALEAESLGIALPPVASIAGEAELAPPSEAIGLDCVSGSVRKSGLWVKSRRYRLALKSANVRLDLREYEGSRGFRLLVELDARSSSLRLIVPEGFEVEDRFSERVSSTVRNKPKESGYGDNLVVLTGSLSSSTVRVKYR